MLRKVLIIDDSSMTLHMYRMLFARYRCKIVTALNGREGLDCLAKHRDVDLVLVDINMPVMNGLDFIRTVKSQGTHDHIPIIIVSTEGVRADTKALGAQGYVSKPILPRSLHALVEQITTANA